MSMTDRMFRIDARPTGAVPLHTQRKRWLFEFLKVYSVLIIVYGGFYLLRTNFKSAQPFLVDQIGLTTTQLGTIGFALSWLYGAYNAGATSFSISGPDFDFGRFLIYLLVNAPWVCLEILGMRVVLEIAAKSGGPTGGRQF